jgi:hypothetical protein
MAVRASILLTPAATCVVVGPAAAGGVFTSTLGLEAIARLHGGPPLVLLNTTSAPPGATQRHLQQQQQQQQGAGAGQGASAGGGSGYPYYLGVGHYWVPRPVAGGPPGRRYIHFLYKAAAKPPFQVTQVGQAGWGGGGAGGRVLKGSPVACFVGGPVRDPTQQASLVR